MQEPAANDPREPARRVSPVPFVVALVGFVVIAVLAFTFLRDDEEGHLVRPDRLTLVDDDVIRATALDQPGCGRIERAQVDLAEDQVLVELVTVDAEGPCSDVTVDLVAEVHLPEPAGDRRVRAGVGRLQLPCAGKGAEVVCELAG